MKGSAECSICPPGKKGGNISFYDSKDCAGDCHIGKYKDDGYFCKHCHKGTYQNKEGQKEETESISAWLYYPGVSPLHCFLKDLKRVRYTAASDEDALKAYMLVTKFENFRLLYVYHHYSQSFV